MPLHTLAQGKDPTLVVGFVDMPPGGKARFDVGCLLAGPGEVPQHQRVVEIVADKAVAFEPLVGIAGGDRQIAGSHADGQRPCSLRARDTEQQHRTEPQRRLLQQAKYVGSSHLVNSLCHLHPIAPPRRGTRLRRSLRRDAHPGQILKPALCLDKALYFRRHRARVEVVDDEDHHRLAPFELM